MRRPNPTAPGTSFNPNSIKNPASPRERFASLIRPSSNKHLSMGSNSRGEKSPPAKVNSSKDNVVHVNLPQRPSAQKPALLLHTEGILRELYNSFSSSDSDASDYDAHDDVESDPQNESDNQWADSKESAHVQTPPSVDHLAALKKRETITNVTREEKCNIWISNHKREGVKLNHYRPKDQHMVTLFNLSEKDIDNITKITAHSTSFKKSISVQGQNSAIPKLTLAPSRAMPLTEKKAPERSDTSANNSISPSRDVLQLGQHYSCTTKPSKFAGITITTGQEFSLSSLSHQNLRWSFHEKDIAIRGSSHQRTTCSTLPHHRRTQSNDR